jgi:hypothetical protein
MVPSGHPQIVLNYGRNAGVRNARGYRPLRAFGRWYESAGSRGGQAFHYGMRQQDAWRRSTIDDADRREMVERIAARLKGEYDLKG